MDSINVSPVNAERQFGESQKATKKFVPAGNQITWSVSDKPSFKHLQPRANREIEEGARLKGWISPVETLLPENSRDYDALLHSDRKGIYKYLNSQSAVEKKGLLDFCAEVDNAFTEACILQSLCTIAVRFEGKHAVMTPEDNVAYSSAMNESEISGCPEPDRADFLTEMFCYTVDFKFDGFKCPSCRYSDITHLSPVMIHEKAAAKIVQRVRAKYPPCQFHATNRMNIFRAQLKNNKLIAVTCAHSLNSPSREQRCLQFPRIVKDTMTIAKFASAIRSSPPLTDSDHTELKKTWSKFFRNRVSDLTKFDELVSATASYCKMIAGVTFTRKMVKRVIETSITNEKDNETIKDLSHLSNLFITNLPITDYSKNYVLEKDVLKEAGERKFGDNQFTFNPEDFPSLSVRGKQGKPKNKRKQSKTNPESNPIKREEERQKKADKPKPKEPKKPEFCKARVLVTKEGNIVIRENDKLPCYACVLAQSQGNLETRKMYSVAGAIKNKFGGQKSLDVNPTSKDFAKWISLFSKPVVLIMYDSKKCSPIYPATYYDVPKDHFTFLVTRGVKYDHIEYVEMEADEIKHMLQKWYSKAADAPQVADKSFDRERPASPLTDASTVLIDELKIEETKKPWVCVDDVMQHFKVGRRPARADPTPAAADIPPQHDQPMHMVQHPDYVPLPGPRLDVIGLRQRLAARLYAYAHIRRASDQVPNVDVHRDEVRQVPRPAPQAARQGPPAVQNPQPAPDQNQRAQAAQPAPHAVPNAQPVPAQQQQNNMNQQAPPHVPPRPPRNAQVPPPNVQNNPPQSINVTPVRIVSASYAISARFFRRSLVSAAVIGIQLAKYTVRPNLRKLPNLHAFPNIQANLHPQRVNEGVLNSQGTTAIVNQYESYKFNERVRRKTHWLLPDAFCGTIKIQDEILTRTIPRDEAGPTSSSFDKRPQSISRTEIRNFNTIYADFMHIERCFRPKANISSTEVLKRLFIDQQLHNEIDDGYQPRWNLNHPDIQPYLAMTRRQGMTNFLNLLIHPIYMWELWVNLLALVDESGFTERINVGTLSLNIADDVSSQVVPMDGNILGECILRAARIAPVHNIGHDSEHMFRHRSIAITNKMHPHLRPVFSSAGHTIAMNSGLLACARKQHNQ